MYTYIYIHTYIPVRICKHIYTYIHIYTYTGWRRLIGCLKLQVIFRKRATNYGALLQKMIYKHKASYDSTPLYRHPTSHK